MRISCVIWLNVYLTMIFPVVLGVDRTEVRVSSSGSEGVREALSWLQQSRFLKLIVSAHDKVRNAVMINPRHRSAGRHREHFG